MLTARLIKKHEHHWIYHMHMLARGTFFDPLKFRNIKHKYYKEWAFYVVESDNGIRTGCYSLTTPPAESDMLVDSDRLYYWLYHFIVDFRFVEANVFRGYMSYVTYVQPEHEYRKATLERLGFKTIRLADTAYGKVWVLYKK